MKVSTINEIGFKPIKLEIMIENIEELAALLCISNTGSEGATNNQPHTVEDKHVDKSVIGQVTGKIYGPLEKIYMNFIRL